MLGFRNRRHYVALSYATQLAEKPPPFEDDPVGRHMCNQLQQEGLHSGALQQVCMAHYNIRCLLIQRLQYLLHPLPAPHVKINENYLKILREIRLHKRWSCKLLQHSYRWITSVCTGAFVLSCFAACMGCRGWHLRGGRFSMTPGMPWRSQETKSHLRVYLALPVPQKFSLTRSTKAREITEHRESLACISGPPVPQDAPG